AAGRASRYRARVRTRNRRPAARTARPLRWSPSRDAHRIAPRALAQSVDERRHRTLRGPASAARHVEADLQVRLPAVNSTADADADPPERNRARRRRERLLRQCTSAGQLLRLKTGTFDSTRILGQHARTFGRELSSA